MSKSTDIVGIENLDKKLSQDIRNWLKNNPESKYTKWYMSGLLAITPKTAKKLLENLVASDSNILKTQQRNYYGLRNMWLYYWSS